MPRDLADVLHHFIPEATVPERRLPDETGEQPRAAAGPRIVVAPIGDGDVARAAFLWNLAVEVARTGARARIVTPASDAATGLWPEERTGPFGAEVVIARATNLGQLRRAAEAVQAKESGPVFVFVRVPPLWLRDPRGCGELLRWVLLFSSSDPRDLLESYGITKLLLSKLGDVRIGVTIHGARREGEAEKAFSHLADVVSRRLGHSLTSYGLLVDDLHVYRAMVAGRPVALMHPQSPAARCLRDVSKLLLEDADKLAALGALSEDV